MNRLTAGACCTCFVFLVLLAAHASRGADSKPGVTLLLSEASAERYQQDTLFRCAVTLENATGKELTVRSNFTSAFDGLELVVTTRGGKVLAQQSYTVHQSPFAPAPREFTLKEGATEARLVFPIRDLPGDTRVVKVRLVGTLPGSTYKRILSTETIEVRIK